MNKNITPFGIDKPHTFEKIQRVAVICPYKEDFLRFCEDNPDNKKSYFHVYSLETVRGYIFDWWEKGSGYWEVKNFDLIVDYINERLPNESCKSR